MGHSKALIALLLVLIAPGCASVRWSLQKPFRKPGEHLETFPEGVWEEYDCDSQKLPFFLVEQNELVPRRVRTGGEFAHRMVYVLCPPQPTGVVAGSLATRIRFRGTTIFGETTAGYEIKPGRWVIDSLVELPDDAEPGVYAYELEFRSSSVSFEKLLTFVVARN